MPGTKSCQAFTTSMLSSLPPELLYKVGLETTRLEDRKSLRRTCSLFAEIFRAHVLAEVTLNIHGDKLDPGISLLQALVDDQDSKSGLAKFIKTLCIESLSPSYSLESEREFERKQGECRISYHAETLKRSWVKTESDTVSIAERKLQMLLEPALKSLSCLRSIRWQWLGWKESIWTLNAVVASLSTIHNIEDYAFHYEPPSHSRFPPLPPFPDFGRLQKISISGTFFNSSITSLIDRLSLPSTYLTTLRLFRERSYHRFFHLNAVVPSTILNLSLAGFMLDFSQIVHGNLTSLELGDVYSPGTQNLDTKLNALWISLLAQDIRLQSLILSSSATEFTDGFFNYLQSYRGLEVLSFRGPWAYSEVEYDDAANRFYRDVLPMHADSLVKLELRVVFESRWCFGEHNVEAFRRCRKLKSLWVKIDHRGLEEDPTPYKPDIYADNNSPLRTPFPNSVHLLLEMISSYIPDLERLTIEPARNPEWAHHRGDGIWLLGAKFCLGIRRRLHASVQSFVAWDSSSTISVSGDVRNWVRVYVGNERVVVPVQIPSHRNGMVSFKKKSALPVSILQKVIRRTKSIITV
ncbi:hypothetical protein C8J55DRAFT_515761 [Lentinula edodes]|uniref:F-box domain-containing protein n=1 Tax=Lentinula lateritia TaxID=40482 RepID=A0A9W9AB91_9AGAR|nr:hypothetical protein C8J55DRAFT_515761 [Lentinula edodes]